MSKKTFATIGMILSIIIVFMGLLVMGGAMSGEMRTDTDIAITNYLYDSGHASFGADFYTFVNNNAAEAAEAARAAAGNARIAALNVANLSKLLQNALGLLLIGAGMLGFCHFGIVRCDCSATAVSPAPIAPAEAEPAAEPEKIPEPEDIPAEPEESNT